MNRIRLPRFAPSLAFLTILFGGASIAFAALVTWALFQQDLKLQADKRAETAHRLATLFDHELSIRAHTARAMQLMAQQFLEGHESANWTPVRHLKREPKRNGFTLELPPGFNPADLGNITGIGSVPAQASQAAREMAMALALTPLFKVTTERDPETPWVYYTSALDFMYLFPRVSPDDFFYSERIRDLDFVKGALPSANPSRSVFWSPVYMDEAGKGWLVTVSAPVYERDAFRGAVSIDISVNRLSWLLHRYDIANSKIHLSLGDGHSLVDPKDAPLAVRPDSLPSDTLVVNDSSLVMAIPLQIKDWYIVVQTDRLATMREAAKNSVSLGLVALFLCGVVALAYLLAKALRNVERLSVVDALTGLYNRRMFDANLAEELSRIRRHQTALGLIMFDVDFFKRLNDSFGHHEGDKALQAIAQAIRGALKRSTDKVFRIGGEEFAALVNSANASDLEEIARRMCEAVRDLALPNPDSPYGRVTISIGLLHLGDDCDSTPDQAYSRADAALYRAKAEGRDCVRVA